MLTQSETYSLFLFLHFWTLQFIWNIRCFHCFSTVPNLSTLISFGCRRVVHIIHLKVFYVFKFSVRYCIWHLVHTMLIYFVRFGSTRIHEYRTPIGLQCLWFHFKYQAGSIHVGIYTGSFIVDMGMSTDSGFHRFKHIKTLLKPQ